MKKLMILGASVSQLPLIEAAKRMGVYTIAASTPGEWPGLITADEASITDISDSTSVCEAAKALQIDGITTCCLDTGVPAIGFTAENLGLPGPTCQAARAASNKLLMKEAFVSHGVSTANYVLLRNKKDLEGALQKLKFPVVTKAVDLMGSRGIYRCNTPEEGRSNYLRTMEETNQDYCIIEEFLEGTVFGAEAMIQDGEMVFCMLDNTEVHMSHVPTPVGHSIPFSGTQNVSEKAVEQVRKAAAAVGLDNCPVNCDLIERDGDVYVLEITGRAGATCLPEITGYLYGINYYEAIVRLALGMPVKEMFRTKRSDTAVLAETIRMDRGGIVKEIRNTNPPSNDLLQLSIDLRPGDEVRPYSNGRDRLGQVILTGNTLSDCRRKLQIVLDNIDIEI